MFMHPVPGTLSEAQWSFVTVFGMNDFEYKAAVSDLVGNTSLDPNIKNKASGPANAAEQHFAGIILREPRNKGRHKGGLEMGRTQRVQRFRDGQDWSCSRGLLVRVMSLVGGYSDPFVLIFFLRFKFLVEPGICYVLYRGNCGESPNLWFPK